MAQDDIARPRRGDTRSLNNSGAHQLINTLVDLGVDTVFGYPGGSVLPVYDALFEDARIRHVLVRHEAGAAHAAEGYARSTGRTGVVLVTSGPGVVNTITGLADALMDSIPMVVISGQVPTHLIGTDAFQECDSVGLTRHCTKHNYLVQKAEDVDSVLREAFAIASNGRPGPVVVALPKDVQVAKADDGNVAPGRLRVFPPSPVPPDAVAEAVRMISEAQRPVLYTGGGVINSGYMASAQLRHLASLSKAPVTSTLMGLGAFPASSPQWLGMTASLAGSECRRPMR